MGLYALCLLASLHELLAKMDITTVLPMRKDLSRIPNDGKWNQFGSELRSTFE